MVLVLIIVLRTYTTIAGGGTKVTLETVFSSDATIYAHWTYTGGGSGGGGGATVANVSLTPTSANYDPGNAADITVTLSNSSHR